jgi:hypothetical protein
VTAATTARAIGAAAEEIRSSATGRHRYTYVPVYLVAAVWLLSFWWQSSIFLLLLGVAMVALSSRLGWASEKEWRLLASGLLTGAFVLLVTWPLHGVHSGVAEIARAVTIVGFMAPMSVMWWDSRRIRKGPVRPQLPEIVELWRDQVATKIPQLRGLFDLATWDPATNSITMELDQVRADQASRLAREVENAINGMDGSVRLRPVPDGRVRQMVVQHIPDPRILRAKVDYAVDAALDEKGRLLLGKTSDHHAWYLPTRRPNGCAHISVTGATGSGKGVTVRRVGAAFAAHPRVFMIVIDLKGGTGVPVLSLGADIYAASPEEIRLATEISAELFKVRMARYNALKRSGWSSARDPMIANVIDEIQTINQPENRHLVPVGRLITTGSAQGRSLGYQFTVTAQRNDGESMISPTTRSNLMGGGTAVMHKPGDTSARHLGSQDFDVDPSRIPGATGWAYALCSVETAMTEAPVLVQFTPTRDEIEDGAEHPFGSIEDWLTQRRQIAELHPSEQKIADRWEFAPAPAVDPAALVPAPLELAYEPAADDHADSADIEHQFDVRGKGVHESAGHARAIPLPPTPTLIAPPTHREAVEAIFRGAGEPLRRSMIISRMVTFGPNTTEDSKRAQVAELLVDLRNAGLIEQVTDDPRGRGFWRWTGRSS